MLALCREQALPQEQDLGQEINMEQVLDHTEQALSLAQRDSLDEEALGPVPLQTQHQQLQLAANRHRLSLSKKVHLRLPLLQLPQLQLPLELLQA